ncbi:MAG: VOC family protein [Rhodospirillaceae bacterium]|nr:VOC family protein [Rhodospirillaceae bacterium]
MPKRAAKITPFLWYVNEAEEAAKFYVSLFPKSRIRRVWAVQTDNPSGKAGKVKVVEFTLNGQPFSAMSAGPLDPFNHAVSFMVSCETQKEIDRLWSRIKKHGGEEQQCGWIRDRYGLCWQIVPATLNDMMADPDTAKAKRTAKAMMSMVKFNIAKLKKAHAGK